MKIPHLRWYVAALLFLATVINYVDRQALSVVAPVLTKELQLTPVTYANILQAFLWAYTVMYVVSGIIVDRWGTRIGLAAFMLWWSVANMLHGLVTSAFQLGAFRFLLGAGESGNFMAAVKVTSEWFPASERAVANGIVQAGAAVGAIVSGPLIVWLYLTYGWRSTFVITGALGLIWLIGWLWLYHLPQHHPRITDSELQLLASNHSSSGTAVKIKWVELLRIRQTWGLFLARLLSSPVWWFYLFWLPKYLVEQRGFTMQQMGMLVWLPYLCADFGSILGGLLSGWMIKRGTPVLRARTLSMLPFALVMPLSVLIALTPSTAVTMAVICIVTFSHMAWMTNLTTVTNDIYPREIVGSVAGIAAFGNGLGGALFTSLTGYIVQHFSYNAVFVIMGFLHPAAFLLFRLLVKGSVSPQQPATVSPTSDPAMQSSALPLSRHRHP
ncbi:MAG: MFS transporter [Bryobacteraceae bacterium]|nr:MFS transporter [Bryobacteraceae bacterium]